MPPNWSVSFREKPQSVTDTSPDFLSTLIYHPLSLPFQPYWPFCTARAPQLRAFFARALSSPSFLFPQIILMASFPTASLHSNLYLNANISEMLFLTPV